MNIIILSRCIISLSSSLPNNHLNKTSRTRLIEWISTPQLVSHSSMTWYLVKCKTSTTFLPSSIVAEIILYRPPHRWFWYSSSSSSSNPLRTTTNMKEITIISELDRVLTCTSMMAISLPNSNSIKSWPPILLVKTLEIKVSFTSNISNHQRQNFNIYLFL